MRKRLFNPAVELSKRLGKLLGVRVRDGLFERVPFLQSQKEMPAKERQLYLHKVLSLKVAPEYSLGKVLLVDDLMTTGATLTAATNCLLAAGNGPVYGLVLARVL